MPMPIPFAIAMHENEWNYETPLLLVLSICTSTALKFPVGVEGELETIVI